MQVSTTICKEKHTHEHAKRQYTRFGPRSALDKKAIADSLCVLEYCIPPILAKDTGGAAGHASW